MNWWSSKSITEYILNLFSFLFFLLTGGVSYPQGKGGFWHWPSKKRHLWSQVSVLLWLFYAFKQSKCSSTRILYHSLLINVMRNPITCLQPAQTVWCLLARQLLITAVTLCPPVPLEIHQLSSLVHQLPLLCVCEEQLRLRQYVAIFNITPNYLPIRPT